MVDMDWKQKTAGWRGGFAARRDGLCGAAGGGGMAKRLLVAAAASVLASSVFGATLYVVRLDPSGGVAYPPNYYFQIQDAVNAASDGDTILVDTNHWVLSQPIVVTNNLTIRSLHGPRQTIVDGNNAVQCFDLGSTATIVDGFTITRGGSSDGGGIRCQDYGPALVVNSIVVSNTAALNAGMRGGTARNCLFYGNQGDFGSGGMAYGTAINCTFSRNKTLGAIYSGMNYGTAYNSIFYGNLQGMDAPANSLYYSCAPNVTPGVNGNVAGPPLFVDADANDFRVLPNSPCIDAGSNDYAQGTHDLIGNPRIFNGRVDMGVYEYADNDGDGLRNEDESNIYGTDPTNPDTDGDGFDDGFEVEKGMNPLVPDEDFVAYIQRHSARFSLYPSNAVLDVAVGQLLIGVSNGTAELRLHLQQRDDLATQTDDLATWTSVGDSVEWSIPAPAAAQFLRIRATAE
jgi:hypothetical protein